MSNRGRFSNKKVHTLSCQFCCEKLCNRGMKALLLADVRTQLYSTDAPPKESCALVGNHYETNSCNCKIRNVACSTCGNIVGYHVAVPCTSCLSACNNGHLWMFHGTTVQSAERKRSDLWGEEEVVMTWADLPSPKFDTTVREEPFHHRIRPTKAIFCR
eukprot:m.76267 g.76267  ORF g.76267 m.76267 type:complete len:159 (+) comp11872_c0_seq2:410-886(+)